MRAVWHLYECLTRVTATAGIVGYPSCTSRLPNISQLTMFLSVFDHSFRCQKNGWEKPVVDTVKHPFFSGTQLILPNHQRKHGEGWTFVVSLSRINKRTSQKETVRFEPHPPYTQPTALEARHWGATYALYRVRGLHFVLLSRRVSD